MDPYNQLNEMSISCAACTLLREKAGIALYRVQCGDSTAILKCFDRPEDRREIDNYTLLRRLHIPTLPILAQTDRALLLPDLTGDGDWRLAAADDLKDERVLTHLARWYRLLHQNGRAYVSDSGAGMYDENNLITRENLRLAELRTDTASAPVWALLDAKLDSLCRKIASLPRTLTYNDFDWTNMAVARDGSAAMMFDYHLLGKGYVFADLRNVLSGLPEPSKPIFCAAYGACDPDEEHIDAVAAPLVSLIIASQRETFPDWALDEVEHIRDGTLLQAVQRLEL